MSHEPVDFRVPISFVIRRWTWITLVAALSGLAALGISLLLPRAYQAEATLVISPSRTEVQFDPRIVTIDEYELARGSSDSRREALAALVTSNEVVAGVLAESEQFLESDERDIDTLRDMVNVETAGDLINLEVRHSDPTIAAELANSWASRYEEHVNQVYHSAGGASQDQIAEQVESARRSYESAQVALETYEANDRTLILQGELDTKTALLVNYQQARIAAETRPVDRNQAILNNYYSELAQVDAWLADAQALREQVGSDAGSEAGNAGNALALILLRGRAFGGQVTTYGTMSTNPTNDEVPAHTNNTGIALQIDLADATGQPITIGDVDALISALETRRNAAQLRIDEFLLGMEGEGIPPQTEALTDRIDDLTMDIATLESELEATGAELRELTQTRDGAWDTYQVLVGRQVERQISSESASTEIRIADTAIVPSEPLPRGTVRNTLLACVLGAILTIFILLAYAVWNIDQMAPLLGAEQESAPRRGPAPNTGLAETAGQRELPGMPEKLHP